MRCQLLMTIVGHSITAISSTCQHFCGSFIDSVRHLSLGNQSDGFTLIHSCQHSKITFQTRLIYFSVWVRLNFSIKYSSIIFPYKTVLCDVFSARQWKKLGAGKFKKQHKSDCYANDSPLTQERVIRSQRLINSSEIIMTILFLLAYPTDNRMHFSLCLKKLFKKIHIIWR